MKNKGLAKTKRSGRYIVLLAAFVCMLFVVISRLSYLHVIKHDFLRAQGEARTHREIKIAAYRGMIKDRNGQSLAISTPVDSVWVNPQEVNLADPKLKFVAQLLNLSGKNLREKIQHAAKLNKEFVYLRRQIDPRIGKKIKDLQVTGVHLLPEYRRYYPAGEVTAQVLGTTNIDDIGLEGLEYAYNSWLQGKPGKKLVEKDRIGRAVESLANIREVQPGNDLTLSLDARLQYLAYKAVRAAVIQHKAVSGTAVVLDVRTGEVLAMVNNPSFNPNKREMRKQHSQYRNVAVTDAFEPGSVMKTISMTGVLERTKITPSMLVDTGQGYLKLPGGIVRDIHRNGTMEVSDILKESSNIGITKLVLKITPKELVDTYTRLGFGMATNSGFPGESAGSIVLPRPEQSFVLATLSFGYGISATPLQLAQAYAIIGAGGIKRPVSFLKVSEEVVEGERVLQAKVARQVLDLLSTAAEHDRSNARVFGYRVAGKTGTAHKLGKKGYDKKRYRSLFAGLAPAINPRVAIVVAIDEPRSGEYYGNQVAAPVFSRIASGALRLFKIAPDLLDTHGVHVASSNNGSKH